MPFINICINIQMQVIKYTYVSYHSLCNGELHDVIIGTQLPIACVINGYSMISPPSQDTFVMH